MKRLIAWILFLAIMPAAYPADDWAQRYPSGTPLQVITPTTLAGYGYLTSLTGLKLDQTTHQHIINGYPRFDAGIGLVGNYGLYWRDIADANTIAYISYDGDLTMRAVTGDLKFVAGGGDIDFDNDNLTTTGTLSAGETTVDRLTTDVDGIIIKGGEDIRPSANSTTAINIAQADGTGFVVFDTTNKRVGINTTPGSELDVRSTAQAKFNLETSSATLSSYFQMYTNGGSKLEFLQYGASATGTSFGISRAGLGLWNGDNTGGIVIGSKQNVPMYFGTNNLERARIIGAGQFFIGTTDTDGTPAIGHLTVKGTTNDGSTNIFVGRDSDEANVASLNTNGSLVLSIGPNYAVDAGASDDYAVTITNCVLQAGTVVYFDANTANTGACTLNLNGGGAVALKSLHDQDPADNYIEAGSIVHCMYDGSVWQILSPDANP